MGSANAGGRAVRKPSAPWSWLRAARPTTSGSTTSNRTGTRSIGIVTAFERRMARRSRPTTALMAGQLYGWRRTAVVM